MMTGPTKAAREAIAATQRARSKPLERAPATWRMLAGSRDWQRDVRVGERDDTWLDWTLKGD